MADDDKKPPRLVNSGSGKIQSTKGSCQGVPDSIQKSLTEQRSKQGDGEQGQRKQK